MTSCKFEKSLKFTWCGVRSFVEIPALLMSKLERDVRICCLSTQIHYLYLVCGRDHKLRWAAYELIDNALRPVDSHRRKTRGVDPCVLENADALHREMRYQMILQWRDCVESYYDVFPTQDEIISALEPAPVLEILDMMRLPYHDICVQRDPEWDGAIEVPCDGGYLAIPFVEDGEDGPRTLVVKYATYLPDSRLEHLTSKLSTVVGKVGSAVRSCHWSNLRLRVDNIGGKHGI